MGGVSCNIIMSFLQSIQPSGRKRARGQGKYGAQIPSPVGHTSGHMGEALSSGGRGPLGGKGVSVCVCTGGAADTGKETHQRNRPKPPVPLKAQNVGAAVKTDLPSDAGQNETPTQDLPERWGFFAFGLPTFHLENSK